MQIPHVGRQDRIFERHFESPGVYGLEIGSITLKCNRTTERSSDDGSPTRIAMDRRFDGRLVLGSLLEHLFRREPSRKQPFTGVDQDRLVLPRVLSAARGWLNDFENEMLEEKVSVDGSIADLPAEGEGDTSLTRVQTMLKIHGHTEEDQIHFARWEAEFASQRDLLSRVLKLVLKAQADELISKRQELRLSWQGSHRRHLFHRNSSFASPNSSSNLSFLAARLQALIQPKL
jgi:hypothetical protein